MSLYNVTSYLSGNHLHNFIQLSQNVASVQVKTFLMAFSSWGFAMIKKDFNPLSTNLTKWSNTNNSSVLTDKLLECV